MMKINVRLFFFIFVLLANVSYAVETTALSPQQQKSNQALKRSIKKALTDEKYPLAISLLTKLYTQGDDEQKAFALEYLGVARERNFQFAFAKQYYEKFLKLYPKHRSITRVKQRLSTLIGIDKITEKKRLRDGKSVVRTDKDNIRGSLATDYRNSSITNDVGDTRQTLSLVAMDMDVRGEYQLSDSSLQFRFSGGHYQDLLSGGGSTGERLRYANISWQDGSDKFKIDFGRQRSRGKGLFNRFDGAVVGYKVDDNQQFNLYFGAPVSSSKILSIDPDRRFVGVSLDLNDYFENFDISVFGVSQTIGSFTDRQAVGGEVKYFGDGKIIYGLVDYDIFHSDLNAFLISGSFTDAYKTRYHLSFNKRKSPYISTRNALIGQSADSLEELRNLLITDEEILNLAADRTLESTTGTLQVSRPITDKLDLSGSMTWLDLSGAPASGGVAEITQPGAQLYYNLYLRYRNLYSASDSNQAGIRVSKLSSSDVSSFYISSQYRWDNSWSVSLKLRYDDRSNHNGGGQQNITPSMRMQYQLKQHYFYADIGAIFYTNQITGIKDVNTDIFYAYLGYRWYF